MTTLDVENYSATWWCSAKHKPVNPFDEACKSWCKGGDQWANVMNEPESDFKRERSGL